MTKQEHIEEMARAMCNRSIYEDTCVIDKNPCYCSNCSWKTQAEALYNAGYRKVLLDTEYGKEVDCAQYVPWNFIDWYTEREVKKARKETAKEILQCLYDKCYEISNMGRGGIAHVLPIDILQMAKNYGVEVEE